MFTVQNNLLIYILRIYVKSFGGRIIDFEVGEINGLPVHKLKILVNVKENFIQDDTKLT